MASYRAFYIQGPGNSWQSKLRLAAAAIVGLAILSLVVVVSLSLALILIPLGFVAYLFRRQILKRMLGSMSEARTAGDPRAAQPDEPGGVVTIDADYRIVRTDSRKSS